MKDKEVKVEEIEVSHTLCGVGDSVTIRGSLIKSLKSPSHSGVQCRTTTTVPRRLTILTSYQFHYRRTVFYSQLKSLSYQIDTVRPGGLSTKTLSTETDYQQDLINRDLLSTRFDSW